MSLKGAMDPIWCIDGISVWKYGIFTWIKQIIVKVINNFEINFFICDNLHALYISHEQNSTYSVFMHVCEAWQPLLSLQIYSNNQLQMV